MTTSSWALTYDQAGNRLNFDTEILDLGNRTLTGGDQIVTWVPTNGGIINFNSLTIAGSIDATDFDDGTDIVLSNITLGNSLTPADSYTVTVNNQSRFEYQTNDQSYTYFFTGTAGFINVPFMQGLGLNFILDEIQLDKTDTVYSVNAFGGTVEGGGNKKDLLAKLTGLGTFEFVIDNGQDLSDADRYAGAGHLYVGNRDGEVNAYTGDTIIGKYIEGATINDSVILHAMNDGIFGVGTTDDSKYTDTLNIKTNSGLEMGNTEQWTHALAGGGYINLEGADSLLHVKDNARAEANSDVMEVYNDLRGSGTVWVDFSGGGIRFNADGGNDFTGWVVIQDAYNIVQGNDTAVFHNNESHLLLAENGVLQINGADDENNPETTTIGNLSVGYTYNEIFNKDRMSGAAVSSNSAATLEFHVNPSDAVHDYLIVNNLKVGSGRVTVDFGSSFNDMLQDLNGSLLTADEGEHKTLIRVTGEGKDEANQLIVDMDDSEPILIERDDGTDIAKTTWSFDKRLSQISDTDWALGYSLSKVELLDTSGEGLVLTVGDAVQSDADRDFTAYVTGSGNLTIRDSGERIILGSTDSQQSANDYSGQTFVGENTTVEFQADKAMGSTSRLNLSVGSIVDLAGHKQTVLDLSGSGTLIVDDGAELTLDRSNQSGSITVDASLQKAQDASGGGTFIVKSSGGWLNLTSDDGYDGNVILEHTNVGLSGSTGKVLSQSHLTLNNRSTVHVGSSGGNLEGLSADTGASIVFDDFLIGKSGGTKLTLGNGSGTASGNFNIELPTSGDNFDISDSLLLIESDNPGSSQTIVSGDVSGATFALSGAGTGGTLVVTGINYLQKGNNVAETNWSVSLANNGASGLGLKYMLTGINLLATGDNYLIIDTNHQLTGTNEQLTLRAPVSGSGNISFNAADGQTIVFTGQANTYTGRTQVQNGTLSLGADNVLGVSGTSLLDVQGGATLLLNATTQTAHGLSGTGTIDLGTGTLNLTTDTRTNQTIGNAITGDPSGTLAVDLSGGELSFANNASDSWSGRLSLSNTLLMLSGATATALDAVHVAANAGTQITIDSAQDTLASLSMNGSTLVFEDVVLGGANSSSLNIMGALSGSGSVSFSGPLSVSDNINLLDADDGDLTQIVISARSIAEGTTLRDSLDDYLSGVSVQGGVALTNWTLSNTLVLSGSGFGIEYQLDQIDLRSEQTPLSLSKTDDGNLSALVTGAGSISFDGGDITISNSDNSFTGTTFITSGSLTLGADTALGSTNNLNVSSDATFNVNGHTQTVGALTGSGTVNFGTADGSLTVDYAAPKESTAIGNIISGSSGTLSFVDAGNLTFTNTANTSGSFTGALNLGANTRVDLSDNTTTTAAVVSGTNFQLSSGASATFGDGGTSGSIDLIGLDIQTGATVSFDGIDLTSTSARASVITRRLTGSSGFSVDMDLTAPVNQGNVLAADDRYSRYLIQAGGVDSDLLGISGGLTESTSVITNADGATVAYGTWSGGWAIDESGMTASGALAEIQLADAQGSGLVLDAGTATGSGAELSSKLADWIDGDGQPVYGNLTVSGTQAITIANEDNNYHGATTVSTNSTLIVTGTLGYTSILTNSGSVLIGSATDPTTVNVGGLSGSGNLSIQSESRFVVSTSAKQLTIDNLLSSVASGTFAVSGTGTNRTELDFSQNNSGADGIIDLTNIEIDFSDSDNYNKTTLLSSSGLRLTNSLMTVDWDDRNASDSALNVLYANNSTITFTGIELASGADSSATEPLLHIGDLSIEDGTKLTLDVSAELTENSNLLQLDNSPYDQALIEYESSDQESDLGSLIQTSDAVQGGTTEYRQGGSIKAYVTWGGGAVSVNQDSNTISASYMLTGIQLFDDKTSGGLVLSAVDEASGQDAVLSAVISDYENSDSSIIAGNVTYAGNMTIGADVNGRATSNSYTGNTIVSGGTLTLAKTDALGHSKDVTVNNGAKIVFAADSASGPYVQEVGALHTSSGGALSGNVDLTLGYGGVDTESSIRGANTGLSGSLTLASGHRISVDNAGGLGGMTVSGQALTTEEGSTSNARVSYELADASELANQFTGALDVSLAVSGTANWTGANNAYTGMTAITGSTAVLGAGVLGSEATHTAELNLSSGGAINLNGTTQYIGSIQSSGENALTGSGTLVIDNGGQIADSNNVGGIITLLSGELTITNVEAIGSAQANLNAADAGLIASGIAGTGDAYVEFDNDILGSGSFTVADDSRIELTGNNTFAGGLDVLGSLRVQGDVNSHIGKGAVINISGNVEFNGSGEWKLSNKLTGSGNLSASAGGATNEFQFGYKGTLATDFTGDIELSSGLLTLSGNTSINARTIASTDLTLGDDGILHVSTGYTGTTDAHARSLTVGSAGQIVFTDLTPWDSTYAGVTVGRVEAQNGAVIDVSSINTSTGTSSSIAQNQIIHADNGGLSQALINAAGGVSGTFALAGATDGHVSKTVNIGDGTVGTATYDLSLFQDETSVDLSYQLTAVNVNPDQQLVLAGSAGDSTASSGDSILSALVTGSGGLEIADNAVRLTNSGNSYSGTTTVQNDATLYAEEDTLGETNLLDVLGAAYVDDNEVDVLNVGETGTLHLTGDLTIDGGAASVSVSSIDGKVLGSGGLRLNAGTLTVSSNNAGVSGYTGTVTLSGTLNFADNANLGTGVITMAGTGAAINIAVSGTEVMTNTVTSSGDGIGAISVSGRMLLPTALLSIATRGATLSPAR